MIAPYKCCITHRPISRLRIIHHPQGWQEVHNAKQLFQRESVDINSATLFLKNIPYWYLTNLASSLFIHTFNVSKKVRHRKDILLVIFSKYFYEFFCCSYIIFKVGLCFILPIRTKLLVFL